MYIHPLHGPLPLLARTAVSFASAGPSVPHLRMFGCQSLRTVNVSSCNHHRHLFHSGLSRRRLYRSFSLAYTSGQTALHSKRLIMMQRRAASTERKGQKSNEDVDRNPDHHDHSHSLFAHSHSHNGEDGSGHSHDAAHIVAALKGNKRELLFPPFPISALTIARLSRCLGDRGSYITLVGLVSNIILTAAKGTAGWFLHSASLLADAGHSLSGTYLFPSWGEGSDSMASL